MVLITGSNSFLGNETLNLFLSRKVPVRCINQDIIKEDKRRYENIKGDILDKNQTDAACREINTVIHLADSPYSGSGSRSEMRKINIEGTNNILTSAAQMGVEHIIFMSTYMVYKKGKNFPIKEDHPLKPWTNYGKDKLIAENKCFEMCKKFGMKLSIIRPAILKGPDIQNSVILHSLYLSMGLGNDNVAYITGNGDCRSQFISKEDTADAIYKIHSSRKLSGINIFNVGSDNVPSQIEQLIKIKEKKELDFSIKHISFIKAFSYYLLLKPTNINFFTREHLLYLFYSTYLDCDKIKDTLNWSPKKDNIDILSETIDWYRGKLIKK